jgi:ABC-type lipoprotein export system ATPase subunit
VSALRSPNDAPVLRISGVRKNYSGLRPLRLSELAIAAAERVALSGLDAGAAEVLVNLITGASLPDDGAITVLGRTTASIQDGDEWLASLDRFGIVSPRAVLLDGATLLQNLAMPFSLDIEPVPPDLEARTRALALEAGISDEWLTRSAGEVSPAIRARVHLARAIALAPALLLMEHPTAAVPAADRAAFAAEAARVLDGRAQTALIVTEDREFARRVAHRVLALKPATGELTAQKRGWLW